MPKTNNEKECLIEELINKHIESPLKNFDELLIDIAKAEWTRNSDTLDIPVNFIVRFIIRSLIPLILSIESSIQIPINKNHFIDVLTSQIKDNFNKNYELNKHHGH